MLVTIYRAYLAEAGVCWRIARTMSPSLPFGQSLRGSKMPPFL